MTAEEGDQEMVVVFWVLQTSRKTRAPHVENLLRWASARVISYVLIDI